EPLALDPHILIVDQRVVARRPDVAATRRWNHLITRRRRRRAEDDVHLGVRRRKRRRNDRRRRKECGGGKGRDRHTLQHDLPPFCAARGGTTLMEGITQG